MRRTSRIEPPLRSSQFLFHRYTRSPEAEGEIIHHLAEQLAIYLHADMGHFHNSTAYIVGYFHSNAYIC